MTFDPAAEFDRQVRTLVDKGYPAAAGMPDDGFVELLRPLRRVVLGAGRMVPPTPERVPFVLVVTGRAVPTAEAMARTELSGRPGFVSADTADIARFQAIEPVRIPAGQVYAAVDVERGADYLNVRPDDALVAITARGRTPLTVDEGIALITQFPASLERNHCFSLLASRCGDRRVPALWISRSAPKLGWCWAGNPHTWLGSASCAGRHG